VLRVSRLTPRQLLLLRNPPPPRASGIAYEYLLLTPRSAAQVAPAPSDWSLRHDRGYPPYSITPRHLYGDIEPPSAFTPGASSGRRTETVCPEGRMMRDMGPVWGPAYSRVHFKGYPIKLVSYYALLRRCQLPWPRPSCLYGATPVRWRCDGDPAPNRAQV